MKNFLFVALLCQVFHLPGQEEISIDSLMKHVSFFSSPLCRGRLPGTQGYQAAIQYCQEKLFSYGIKPTYRDLWPQIFPIETNTIDSASVTLFLKKKKIPLKAGFDFSVRGYSGSGNITAPLVFAGYGLDLPEYSDYQNISVKGKIVMVFKSNPPFIKDLPTYSVRKIADIAYKKGAIGVIFLPSIHSFNPSDMPIGSVADGEGEMHKDLPQIQLHGKLASLILKKDLAELQKQIDSLKKPKSFLTKAKAHIFVSTSYNPNGYSSNVVGMVNGNDPELKKEYIVISAHLDHVGFIGKEVYYPGANDNASGSAAVLELARNILAHKDKLKQSVIFILFGSEEKGMEGSTYFVNHIPVPADKIKAVFNLDCIGHGDSIQIGNGETSPELWQQAYSIAKQHNFPVTSKTWKGGGADLTPFVKNNIPGLYFVTTHSYTHLHLPTDTPDTFNKKLYQQMVELVYLLAKEWLF
jgi:Zn-dependent M28 family amino/carboxypeptidase